MTAAAIVTPGDVFGRWTLLGVEPSRKRKRRARVRCACGTVRVVILANLRRGSTRGCAGCARVGSLPVSVASRFWPRVEKGSDEVCWPWRGGLTTLGYGYIKTPTDTATHRVAWTLTHGPITEGLFVLHRCDNRACCNPSHLFLGTQQDNVRDMHAKGRARPACGEGHPRARITAATARRIKELARQGAKPAAIAAQTGVAKTTVVHVMAGRTWRAA